MFYWFKNSYAVRKAFESSSPGKLSVVKVTSVNTTNFTFLRYSLKHRPSTALWLCTVLDSKWTVFLFFSLLYRYMIWLVHDTHPDDQRHSCYAMSRHPDVTWLVQQRGGQLCRKVEAPAICTFMLSFHLFACCFYDALAVAFEACGEPLVSVSAQPVLGACPWVRGHVLSALCNEPQRAQPETPWWPLTANALLRLNRDPHQPARTKG